MRTRAARGVRLQKIAAIAFVLSFALPWIGPTGTARANLEGAPALTGAYVVDHGQVLLFIGIIAWGGVYEPETNGSQVFTSTFAIYAYELQGQNVTVTYSVAELGSVTNGSFQVIDGGVANTATIPLQSHTSWTDVELTMGGAQFDFQVSTPLSLLPPSVANTGGLDLLVLAILSEAVIAFASAIVAAKWWMRRAVWAPPFSLLIWGHVVLVTLLGFILFDYQWVDSTFAGWSPLAYVLPVTPMFFLFALSLFNSGPRALLLRANAPVAGVLSFTAWFMEIGQDGKGNWVFIEPTWRGMLARFWEHHVPLFARDAGITQPEPFIANVSNLKILSDAQILKRIRKPSPMSGSPFDRFELTPAWLDGKARHKGRALPTKLFFTPVGRPVSVNWPRLTIWTSVTVPPKLDKATGEVVIPEHQARRLSWPHYTAGSAEVTLHRIHFMAGLTVAAGWRSMESLAEVLSDTSLDLEVTKSTMDIIIAKKVNERLTARLSLTGRTADDMDETEAALEAERTGKETLPTLDQLLRRNPVLTPVDPPKAERDARHRRKGTA